jgi:glutamate transport system substrate-binding protein
MPSTKTLATACGCALALALAACGGGSSTSTPVESKAATEKKLIVGVKADQPGLGLQTGDTFEGYDIEIAKIVAKGLGVPPENIEWKTTVSANREPFIEQGTVDLVVATYTINDERKQIVSFAGPYFVAGQDLMVRADDSTIKGPEDLAGKKVCSVTGSTPAARIQSDYPQAQLQLFDTYSKCVTDLANKQVDAVTTDDIILAGYAAQPQYKGQFKVVGKAFSTEPYGIGMKKGDPTCQKVNDILKQAAADGSYQQAWKATVGASGLPAPTLDASAFANCT